MIDPAQVKAENIALLRSWNIPVLESLPTIENEADLSPRTAADVARRIMVLSQVIGIGLGGNPSALREGLTKFGLWPYASAGEKDLLNRDEHTDQERIDATWLAEGIQSLGWCLGLAGLPHLDYCEADLSRKFPGPSEDPSDFIASAKLRPFDEIYREADLHYRLHWAARSSRLGNVESPVGEGLIRERRKALDWVVGVEEDWDEVPADT